MSDIDNKQINNLVETILELYEPKLGFRLGYAYPLKDSKEGYIWELEKLYEMSEDDLKELMRLLENGKDIK